MTATTHDYGNMDRSTLSDTLERSKGDNPLNSRQQIYILASKLKKKWIDPWDSGKNFIYEGGAGYLYEVEALVNMILDQEESSHGMETQ